MNLVFGPFRLDRQRRMLFRGDAPVHLAPKAFHLLELLLEARPRALSKRELMETIWEGALVEESNLAGLVADVRTALEDEPRDPRYIRTIHGFGYAFCGQAQQAGAPSLGCVVFKGDEFPLREGDNVLGRDATVVDIVIDDATVSRRHAAIRVSDHGMTIEDLSSKNGTSLDEIDVKAPVALQFGQTIILGDARVIVRGSAPGTTITKA